MAYLDLLPSHRSNMKFQRHKSNNNVDIPIHTIYVAPLKPNMQSLVREYFGKFGEVEDVRIWKKNNFCYGFVQFKMAESAQAALSNDSHQFAKVKVANLWHQPGYMRKPSLKVPHQDSLRHILNKLNDDCLRVVFRSLDWADLCNAAEVCARFNRFAKEAFDLRYSDSIKIENLALNKFNSLCNNFGPSVRSLDVNLDSIDSDDDMIVGHDIYLHKMQRSCTNLENLTIRSIQFDEFDESSHQEWRLLFARLEKLQFYVCRFDHNINVLFSVCNKLKRLELWNCDMKFGSQLIARKFPMLEELCFQHSVDGMLDKTLPSLIALNPTIRKLEITEHYTSCPIKIFHLINQKLPNLVECKIGRLGEVTDAKFQKNVVFLGQLELLKVLKINFHSNSISPLIESLTSNAIQIEQLGVSNGIIFNEDVENISKLKSIKNLELKTIDGITDELLIELSKGLPELCEFKLKRNPGQITTKAIKTVVAQGKKLSLIKLIQMDSIEIDEDDYKDMVKSVQDRRKKEALVIKIASNGNKVKVPITTQRENRKWLRIYEHVQNIYERDGAWFDEGWYDDDYENDCGDRW